MTLSKTLLAVAITAAATAAQAEFISFDTGDTGYQFGNGTPNGGSETSGDPITFNTGAGASALKVRGSMSKINLTDFGSFDRTDNLTNDGVKAYQDAGSNAGLGVYSGDVANIGADDSFQSNVLNGNHRFDEVLLFDFSVATILNTVFFNNDHNSATVDAGSNKGDNAVFNIFYSDDNDKYFSVFDSSGDFNNARAPVGGESLATAWATGHQHWAVAATGWGEHSSYVEAIDFTSVPEPSSLALLGLGLAGLGAARRKQK